MENKKKKRDRDIRKCFAVAVEKEMVAKHQNGISVSDIAEE